MLGKNNLRFSLDELVARAAGTGSHLGASKQSRRVPTRQRRLAYSQPYRPRRYYQANSPPPLGLTVAAHLEPIIDENNELTVLSEGRKMFAVGSRGEIRVWNYGNTDLRSKLLLNECLRPLHLQVHADSDGAWQVSDRQRSLIKFDDGMTVFACQVLWSARASVVFQAVTQSACQARARLREFEEVSTTGYESDRNWLSATDVSWRKLEEDYSGYLTTATSPSSSGGHYHQERDKHREWSPRKFE